MNKENAPETVIQACDELALHIGMIGANALETLVDCLQGGVEIWVSQFRADILQCLIDSLAREIEFCCLGCEVVKGREGDFHKVSQGRIGGFEDAGVPGTCGVVAAKIIKVDNSLVECCCADWEDSIPDSPCVGTIQNKGPIT